MNRRVLSPGIRRAGSAKDIDSDALRLSECAAQSGCGTDGAHVVSRSLWRNRAPSRPDARASRSLALASIALLISRMALPAGAAAAAPPPQEPGVTLRTTAAEFGLEDNFLAGHRHINITQAGSYTFQLISGDGSRPVIDNGVVLTTGYHSL